MESGNGGPSYEELDDGPLPPTEDSGRFFRHAERRARESITLFLKLYVMLMSQIGRPSTRLVFIFYSIDVLV